MRIVLLALLVAAASQVSIADPDHYHGAPVATTYPNALTVIENRGFTVAYDETRQLPAWAAYTLGADPELHAFARPSRFRVDDRTQARVSHGDYTNSGFDRGHMAPNFAIMTRFGQEAQRDTFFMSNVVPQPGALNQGPWRLLEDRIANDYANELGQVWVVTGPLFDDEVEQLAAAVEIPDAFFKIVVDEIDRLPRALAFRMNEGTPRQAAFGDFLTSVDAIEAEAGFDFFSELDDTLEQAMEMVTAPALWADIPATSPARAPATTPTPAPTHPAPSNNLPSGSVNVNTASLAELQRIPGVGPVIAQRIIDGRPWVRLDDLIRVRGIGAVTLQRMLAFLRVR